MSATASPSGGRPAAGGDATPVDLDWEVERLRDALVEARESFATLIDAVPDSVTVMSRDGRLRQVNLAACRNFGRDRNALLNLTIYDLNPEIPRDRIEQVVDQYADGEPFVHETVNLRGDGSLFPVEVHSRVFSLHGAPHVIAVARDVSRRRNAERELRESEARYRLLLQAMDKGMLVQDRAGRIVAVNPSACRILGHSEAELLGAGSEPGSWLFIGEDGEPLTWTQLPAIRALRERCTIASTTVGLFEANRQWRTWLSITATPFFREGESEPFQVISTFSDITALKRDSELFLRTQSLARIGGWDLDPRGGEMYWTEPLYRMLAIDPASAVDRERLLDRLHRGDRERVALALDDASRVGTAFDLECRTQGPRGRWRWARIIGEAQLRDGKVFRVSGTVQDITKDKLLEDTLRRQALTDPLTGLANRDAIVERIGTALHEAQLDAGPVVLHVDLDRFKVVNDLLGHEGGDALVRAAGQRLARLLEEGSHLARLSGDEFIVLLPAGGRGEGERVAASINEAFAAPFLHDGEDFSITASVGVAHFPDDGATVQQLLQSADAAMMEAKRRGRNTWQAFNPTLARQISDRLLVETQLRRALEHDEFHLVYQPQVRLQDGRMRSVEALLRWNNRLLGPMRPDIFIPHAETTGDIVRIGAWVIREACRQLRAWRDAGVVLERVAVNVSFRQFLNEDFPQHVLGALAEFALPGDSLELEITERAVLEDAADTVSILRQLKDKGVSVSIDDFGEGYSALNYLRRLPIDALKISHGFMREIPGSTADAVVCRSIIQIAHSLGLTVVGEGVEGVAQQRFLLEHGADLAQGYLFARPMAAHEVPLYEPPPQLGGRSTPSFD
jgi:diguanylate cyclase (GGDEF)-like protein/PAS domain S-box-containing protein